MEQNISGGGSGAVGQRFGSAAGGRVRQTFAVGNTVPVPVDATLTHSGEAADAKATGDAIGEVAADLTALGGTVGALGGRMDGAEESVSALGGRMDGAEEAIDGLGGRMDSAEEAIDGLGNRADEDEESIRGLRVRLTDAEDAVSDIGGRMDTAETAIGALAERMDDDEEAIGGHGSRLDAAESRLDTIAGRMTAAETDISDLGNRIGGAIDDIGVLESRVDEIGIALANKVNVSDIVNNLTQGGANVPLSAEMGKSLSGDISITNGTAAVYSNRAEAAATIVRFGRLRILTASTRLTYTGSSWHQIFTVSDQDKPSVNYNGMCSVNGAFTVIRVKPDGAVEMNGPEETKFIYVSIVYFAADN